CGGDCCNCGLGKSTQTLTAEVGGCKLNVNPKWRQNVGYWATKPYDHSKTIGENGCGLTALTMAFNFAAKTSFDPYWLNAFMTEHDDFNGGSVLFPGTVKDLSQYLRGN